MNKPKVFFIFVLFSSLPGCSNSPQTETTNLNSPKDNNSLAITSHSSENQSNPAPTVVPRSETRKKWSQSGNPIETGKFDAEIKQAEKNLKADPKDEAARKKLSEAYFQRGFALTEARQYASALGDYRRALKYDPDNEEAKNWIGQIIGIYDSINTEYPKEGEEPPPLPYKKETAANTNKTSQ